MGDLHCPATLLVARPGEAENGGTSALADDAGPLSQRGVEQVQALAASLAPRRVAHVYTSTMTRAAESGALAGAALSVGVSEVHGLQELSTGGEAAADAVHRYREALQAIADLHRGETVLVFSHGGVMTLVLPRISGNVRDDLARRTSLPDCAVAEVAVDADGFVLLAWTGAADRPVG